MYSKARKPLKQLTLGKFLHLHLQHCNSIFGAPMFIFSKPYESHEVWDSYTENEHKGRQNGMELQDFEDMLQKLLTSELHDSA